MNRSESLPGSALRMRGAVVLFTVVAGLMSGSVVGAIVALARSYSSPSVAETMAQPDVSHAGRSTPVAGLVSPTDGAD